MKRAGQRRRKRKLKDLNRDSEVQRDRIKFQDKRIKDQQSEIDKQWKEIQRKLQSSDTDL